VYANVMKKTNHRATAMILTVILLVTFGLAGSGAALAADAQPQLNLEATSAILIEASNGQVLYEMNADTPFPPASMAKMMTEYLVLEAISNGKINWDTVVTTSANASKVIGSGSLLAPGEQLTVRDMFADLSIYSGNRSAVALAEHLAGSEEDFANLMNQTARKMGLSEQAHFINATGLSRADMGENAPKTIEGETLLSARDAAMLAYHLLKDHPEVLEFTSIPTWRLRPTDKEVMTNYNWMLEGWKSEAETNNIGTSLKSYWYEGVDGLKTGYTQEAMYCFTGTAKRGDIRLISVVMGTQSQSKRFQETRKLLDYGFNNFEMREVVAAGSEVEGLPTVPVKKGAKTKVPVVTQSSLSILVRKDVKDEDIIKSAAPIDESSIVAPIKEGDVLGTLTVTYNGHSYDVPLVAKEDVNKANWFKLLLRSIGEFFSNLFKSIKNLF